MRISDWSSDVCSSDLGGTDRRGVMAGEPSAVRLLDRRAHRQRRGMAAETVSDDCDPAGVDTPAQRRDAPHRHIGMRGDPAHLLDPRAPDIGGLRSEEHTSELQSLMRISYAVLCLKKTNK